MTDLELFITIAVRIDNILKIIDNVESTFCRVHMERMQEIQQQKANQFWNTHFHDVLDTPIDEAYALEINLWERLKVAFASQDKDTLRAIILTRIAIPIQSTEMFFRIVRLAKHAINNINKNLS